MELERSDDSTKLQGCQEVRRLVGGGSDVDGQKGRKFRLSVYEELQSTSLDKAISSQVPE
jgi:hypothetical protein